MEDLAATLRGIGLRGRAAAKTKARDAYVPFLLLMLPILSAYLERQRARNDLNNEHRMSGFVTNHDNVMLP